MRVFLVYSGKFRNFPQKFPVYSQKLLFKDSCTKIMTLINNHHTVISTNVSRQLVMFSYKHKLIRWTYIHMRVIFDLIEKIQTFCFHINIYLDLFLLHSISNSIYNCNKAVFIP